MPNVIKCHQIWTRLPRGFRGIQDNPQWSTFPSETKVWLINSKDGTPFRIRWLFTWHFLGEDEKYRFSISFFFLYLCRTVSIGLFVIVHFLSRMRFILKSMSFRIHGYIFVDLWYSLILFAWKYFPRISQNKSSIFDVFKKFKIYYGSLKISIIL